MWDYGLLKIKSGNDGYVIGVFDGYGRSCLIG